ncbi:hypothetical protein HDU90_003534 [Geranomyces variabilis]|nr:hypothetical protein HDU90_003534 [Geranomyces variabilis]
MATVCITALAGSAAIAPTPTSTAFPPGTTSVGSTFGVPPDRLCAGKYSFNYTTYNDGPYSRLTVAMFGPRAGAAVTDMDDTPRWAIGAWQESGYYWGGFSYQMNWAPSSTLPTCTNSSVASSTISTKDSLGAASNNTTAQDTTGQASLTNGNSVKLTNVPWGEQEISISKAALVGGAVGIAVGSAALALLCAAIVGYLKGRGQREIHGTDASVSPPLEKQQSVLMPAIATPSDVERQPSIKSIQNCELLIFLNYPI